MRSITQKLGRLRSAPTGLLGMLLAVALIEQVIDRHSLEFTDLMATTWKYSFSKARKDAVHAAILCFGSSLVKFGVVPKAIEERTGAPTFNLAVYGGRVASSYVLLKDALAAGARPKAILIDLHDGAIPIEMRGKPSEALTINARNWPELLTFEDSLEISWMARDPQFLASTAFAKIFHSSRSRNEIRSVILKALKGEPTFADPTLIAALRNWNQNLGTQLMPVPANIRKTPLPAKVVIREGEEGSDNVFLERSLEKLLELAKANHIQVFAWLPPLSPPVQEYHDICGETVYREKVIREAMAIDPSLVVIDGRRSGYGYSAFHDSTHLNVEGALAMSRSIGTAIAEHLRRDQPSSELWVKLPDYKKPANFENVETFDGSKVALKLLNEPRR